MSFDDTKQTNRKQKEERCIMRAATLPNVAPPQAGERKQIINYGGDATTVRHFIIYLSKLLLFSSRETTKFKND